MDWAHVKHVCSDIVRVLGGWRKASVAAILCGGAPVFMLWLASKRRRPIPITFGELLTALQANSVSALHMGDGVWDAVMRQSSRRATVAVAPGMLDMFRSQIGRLVLRNKVSVAPRSASLLSHLFPLAMVLLPAGYCGLIYYVLWRLQNPRNEVGRRVNLFRQNVRFRDVAGLVQAKLEVQELVSYMKDPSRFEALGARFPRGVLFHGPAGTGKTLLARATAGEAGVPFINCSASDFVEMLVGRGAARVRDVFERAQRLAPCIVFVDELDALGKQRGGIHSHDEREQTLNQLLACMDGFVHSGDSPMVLVIGATNRLTVLDSALIRPGRFDRLVHVPLPTESERKAILQVHARRVRLAGDADLAVVANQTPGMSGAELASVVNEAAILAVRRGALEVDSDTLQAALHKVKASRSTSMAAARFQA